ncbi:MAG: hypothetical protein DPW18_07050 [Chloroflexi bacterium]|nr:hypothetical protein [Chloroflexota bacterium]MDL1942316.1 hypothetical protein [Chloroflexi bacterium CFX2]
MILLVAVLAGLLVGMGRARLNGQLYQTPALQHLWLVFVAFLPQFVILYIPAARQQTPDLWAAVFLTASQLLLLTFAWLNRALPGMKILLIGAALNFAVMAANGGFMPISPQTASRLIPEEAVADIPTGERFGTKDILLPPEDTLFEGLADRFLPPAWFPYQVAFSLGDVFLAIGVFWLLASQPAKSIPLAKRITT